MTHVLPLFDLNSFMTKTKVVLDSKNVVSWRCLKAIFTDGTRWHLFKCVLSVCMHIPHIIQSCYIHTDSRDFKKHTNSMCFIQSLGSSVHKLVQLLVSYTKMLLQIHGNIPLCQSKIQTSDEFYEDVYKWYEVEWAQLILILTPSSCLLTLFRSYDSSLRFSLFRL